MRPQSVKACDFEFRRFGGFGGGGRANRSQPGSGSGYVAGRYADRHRSKTSHFSAEMVMVAARSSPSTFTRTLWKWASMIAMALSCEPISRSWHEATNYSIRRCTLVCGANESCVFTDTVMGSDAMECVCHDCSADVNHCESAKLIGGASGRS